MPSFGPVLLVLCLVVLAAALVAVFAILTEGRYFGSSLPIWAYDRWGATIFQLQSEVEQWKGLADQIHLGPGGRLLDIGTAIGDLPISMAELDIPRLRAYGIERSPSMAATAVTRSKERGASDQVEFVLADASDPLPFTNGVFSAVAALGVLEGMRNPDWVLVEMERVLEPEGKLVLSLYRGASSILVSLSERWYKEKLSRLAEFKTERRSLRKSHDILIASR